MLELFKSILDSSDFPNRWHCGNWSTVHGSVHIVSDLAIFCAYLAIPCVLAFFVRQRPDVPYSHIFWLFGVFILSCGVSHLVEATIFWHPWYRLSACVKIVTAGASWATVIALIPLVPRLLTLPGLAAVNARLESEILERRRIEEELRQARDELEMQVQKRTAQLAKSNQALLAEVAERKRAVEDSNINERRLNSVIESAEMGCWELDLINDHAWRSLRHDQIFGYDALLPSWGYEIFMGHVVPADRDPVRESMAKALATGNFQMECRIVWPDGSQHWISAKGRVHRNDQGQPIRMMGLVMNIDAQKDLEQALALQTSELARSNQELELFASVASHDLQEPLRMVASYTELLAQRYQGKLDDKAHRWIGFAVDGVVRMKQLINDLLEFSRVGTRGKPFAPTDCEMIFNRVLQNLQQAIKDHAAEVTSGPLPTIRADDTQIAQVLQNLVANAIKFHGPTPPIVRVEARREADAWLFSVRDNGIGIDSQFAERIFVIFQRLHTREEYPGTGIGLALCKKVVERHGGRIWIESQPGQGTTFFFTLPDRKEE